MSVLLKRFLWIFLLALYLTGCDTNTNEQVENFKLHRYEQALFSLETDELKRDLPPLKKEFGFFLSGDLEDSANIRSIYNYLSDSLINKAYIDVENHFNNLSETEAGIRDLLSNYSIEFHKSHWPEVFTYVSGFDVFGPVQYYDSVLLIALDMYLGPDYEGYKALGIPQYLSKNFDQKYMIRDCAYELSMQFYTETSDLLSLMLSEGKRLYFVHTLLPNLEVWDLFKYSIQEHNWAEKFESKIWTFLLENELLYTGNLEVQKKWMTPAPYTSYFGTESPPRLGAYIGFQIIKHYMNEHPGVSLLDLMVSDDFQEILKNSSYHP